MEMWRFYLELFVLMLGAFAVGSALAALVVRLRVREQLPASDAGSDAAADGTTGGAP